MESTSGTILSTSLNQSSTERSFFFPINFAAAASASNSSRLRFSAIVSQRPIAMDGTGKGLLEVRADWQLVRMKRKYYKSVWEESAKERKQ
ncbi:hypothetical protein ACLOJK_003260 [Asimina triloba]